MLALKKVSTKKLYDYRVKRYSKYSDISIDVQVLKDKKILINRLIKMKWKEVAP